MQKIGFLVLYFDVDVTFYVIMYDVIAFQHMSLIVSKTFYQNFMFLSKIIFSFVLYYLSILTFSGPSGLYGSQPFLEQSSAQPGAMRCKGCRIYHYLS